MMLSYSVGTCHNVFIDNSTVELVEVPLQHSVCFQCLFGSKNMEESDVSWKIGGLVLQSGGVICCTSAIDLNISLK